MKDTLFWLLVQNEEEGKNKRYEKKTKNNCAFVERWSMFHMYTSFSVYHKLHIDWILHLWCLLLCCWDHNVEQLEGPVNNYFWHCKTFDSFWPTAKLSSRSPSKGFQKLFFFFKTFGTYMQKFSKAKVVNSWNTSWLINCIFTISLTNTWQNIS